MKNTLLTVSACLLLASCNARQPASDEVSIPDTDLTGNRGRVLATHDVARYTYVEVRSNGQNIWLAGPAVDVDVGDRVSWTGGSLMTNFRSSSLDRVFPEIYFVQNLTTIVDD